LDDYLGEGVTVKQNIDKTDEIISIIANELSNSYGDVNYHSARLLQAIVGKEARRVLTECNGELDASPILNSIISHMYSVMMKIEKEYPFEQLIHEVFQSIMSVRGRVIVDKVRAIFEEDCIRFMDLYSDKDSKE